ncbi:MAG TPA: hypothetical protein P5572_08785 [Phycisphaerae bacterium]|nr:hypothetical protein [Phycisphaerales bacterium]HRX85100.1 hypothetical protein [Phycisphaerae bacterium]
MFTRKFVVGAGSVALLIALSLTAVTVLAQGEPGEGSARMMAKDVTLQGKVVDLHCYMTADTPPADATKCAECIRAGVPVALETEDGLVMLGAGVKGPAKTCAAHAGQHVTVRGKLYEKAGVKYLEIEGIEAQTASAEGRGETDPS